MSYDDDDLLDYQTETDDDVPMAAVPVEVCAPVVTVPTVAQHATCRTIVVSTTIQDGNLAAGVEELLPYDPLRVRALIYTADEPVVVAHSLAEAQASGNIATDAASVLSFWPDGGGYGSGVQIAPGAGTVLASIPANQLPKGRYLVRVNAGFGTNPETGTDFNLDLYAGSNLILTKLMVTAASNTVRQFTFDNLALDGASSLKLVVRAAASASAVYVGDVEATAIGTPQGVASPSGGLLPVGQWLQINTVQQMMVAATTATATRVTVITERRAP